MDALDENKVELSTLKDDQLPAELRKMSTGERKAYVEEKKKERATVQEKSGSLTGTAIHILPMRSEKLRPARTASTLDTAIISAIRAQAARSNFQFRDK